MKQKIISVSFLITVLLIFTSCNIQTSLTPKDPVTITMWHTYGDSPDSTMNRLIDKFNETEGKEKGVMVSVTKITEPEDVQSSLNEAMQNSTEENNLMPDLFFCTKDTAATLESDKLVNWADCFTGEELSEFVDDFINDGVINDKLTVFPVSKSTQMIYVAGSAFERFSAQTEVSYDDLNTWEGFFKTAEQYYQWSGGKPFCAVDYPVRCAELFALSRGAQNCMGADGWYDGDNQILKECWLEFAKSIAKGHIIVSNLYSNKHVMSGETIAGIGTTASIHYYEDTITYPDGTTENTNLKILPFPGAEDRFVTQSGGGMCSNASDDKKSEAVSVFAHWFTSPDINLEFVSNAGYVPVNKKSYEYIDNTTFKNDSYTQLYSALKSTADGAVWVAEHTFDGYFTKVISIHKHMRKIPSPAKKKLAGGTDADLIIQESWEAFLNVR